MSRGAFYYSQQAITSVAQWDSSAFGSQIELVQLSPGKFHCQQQVLDLGTLQILQLKFNQAVSARSTQHTSRYAAALFELSQAGHFGGAPIEQHELLILPPHLNFDATAKDHNFGCLVAFIQPEILHAYYRALTSTQLNISPDLVHGIRASREMADQLANRSTRLLHAAANSPEAFEQPKFLEAMRDEILTLVAQSLESSTPNAVVVPPPRLDRARKLVRQAEEFILEQPDTHVRLVDLCQQTGVSERTLQYAFQEILGHSPIHYLNQVRLHQVRRSLEHATPLTTTVSAEACRWGFWHFGEFTKAYKALFGELPSETLIKES